MSKFQRLTQLSNNLADLFQKKGIKYKIRQIMKENLKNHHENTKSAHQHFLFNASSFETDVTVLPESSDRCMTNWQVKILPCAHSPSLISCSLEHSSPKSGVDYAPMAFSICTASTSRNWRPVLVFDAGAPSTLSTQKAANLAVDGSRESCSMCMTRHGRPTPNSKTYGRKDTWAKMTRMIPPKPKAPREGRKNRMGRANSQRLQKRANDEERKGSRREESEVATGWYFST